MAISIATSLHPYRMALSRKKPSELTVELINRGDKNAMVSLQLRLSRQLSLDKSGLKSNDTKKIEKLAPNERKRFIFDIHPKSYLEVGEYPLRIKVYEHYQQFKFVEHEYTKNLTISVEN